MTTQTTQHTEQVEPLKLVPFNDAWITHSKLDLKAIYMRPRHRDDDFGDRVRELDKNGNPTWDLTAPLPIKRHNQWRAKGFVYVTLGDLESLMAAGMSGTIVDPATGEPMDWRPFRQHARTGPWNYKRWLAGQETRVAREALELEADVKEFGTVLVERMRKRENPDFVMPENLRNVAPGGEPIAAAKPSDSRPSAKRSEATT